MLRAQAKWVAHTPVRPQLFQHGSGIDDRDPMRSGQISQLVSGPVKPVTVNNPPRTSRPEKTGTRPASSLKPFGSTFGHIGQ